MRKPLDSLLFVYRRVAFSDQGTYQGINTNTFNHVTNTGSLEVQFMLGCRAHYIFKKMYNNHLKGCLRPDTKMFE